MTVCTEASAAGSDGASPFRHPDAACTISADGTYAARLVPGGRPRTAHTRNGHTRDRLPDDGRTRNGPADPRNGPADREHTRNAPADHERTRHESPHDADARARQGTAEGLPRHGLPQRAAPVPDGRPGDDRGDPYWFPERWTLDGPEPYRVPLPAPRPEQPGSEVLPMGDGRVLIHRVVAGRHLFALLHPTSPGTREIPLGSVDCPLHVGDAGARHATATCPATGPALDASCTAVRLLPPVPGGRRAYALAVGAHTTVVWLVAGGLSGPQRVAEVPGRCSGGAWLEPAGRLLAVDQERDGRTKTVTVDLARRGAVSPLLEITENSTDRLLLADPDSGLLLIRSDAPSPGHERLAWGVLGSTLPIRFPECLRLDDCAITPFAIQPGQVLTPERCGVALRIDGAAGSWLAMWRPAERTLHHMPAPEGWLTGCGAWTREGTLHLPYATSTVPCGLVRLPAPDAGMGGRAGGLTRGRAGAGARAGTRAAGTRGGRFASMAAGRTATTPRPPAVPAARGVPVGAVPRAPARPSSGRTAPVRPAPATASSRTATPATTAPRAAAPATPAPLATASVTPAAIPAAVLRVTARVTSTHASAGGSPVVGVPLSSAPRAPGVRTAPAERVRTAGGSVRTERVRTAGGSVHPMGQVRPVGQVAQVGQVNQVGQVHTVGPMGPVGPVGQVGQIAPPAARRPVPLQHAPLLGRVGGGP